MSVYPTFPITQFIRVTVKLDFKYVDMSVNYLNVIPLCFEQLKMILHRNVVCTYNNDINIFYFLRDSSFKTNCD